MKRIQCPTCKEFPRWSRSTDISRPGKECGLCGTVRPIKPRTSRKRAAFEALVKELTT